MGGCASTKAPYCFQLKRGGPQEDSGQKMARWDDNRALREASIEELDSQQLKAFDQFWEQVYVKEILALPAGVQHAIEIAIEERRNDPGKAEVFETSLRQLFDDNSMTEAGILTEEECICFLGQKQALERRIATANSIT